IGVVKKYFPRNSSKHPKAMVPLGGIGWHTTSKDVKNSIGDLPAKIHLLRTCSQTSMLKERRLSLT
ncbi:MAG: hypothetical protein J6M26_04390, partial [Clostridia bacterium]|nr:hypothetical protein [Clostridia bacterium]